MAFGTFSVLDTLAASQQTVAQFGEDNAFQAIDAALDAHNAIMRELLTMFAEPTTDNLRRYGGSDEMSMQELDEYGDPNPQKIAAGSNVGFPLRKYGLALQWTRTAFQVMTGQEMAAAVDAAITADAKAIQRELKRAIFKATNATFLDRLVANVSLPVKAFVNADSAAIPLGPNGEPFNAATHTHYLATAAFVAADLTALIETVVEHQGAGDAQVFINRAQEGAVRAFTGFVAYLDQRITPATTGASAGGALDLINFNNRAIGIYNGAEVWVKPWPVSGYIFAFVNGAPKPLAFRTRNPGGGDLSLIYENETHPLRARSFEREMGVGVYNRVNGAVLYVSGAAYVSPTIV